MEVGKLIATAKLPSASKRLPSGVGIGRPKTEDRGLKTEDRGR